MLNRIFILILSTCLFGLFQMGGVVSSLSDKALDVLFLLRGSALPCQDIVIIGIDEESLDKLGSWPFPRTHHAKLLEKLDHARVIGFDILFTETTSEDKVLSAAIKASPPVVLATAHDYQGHILMPASSITGYTDIGHIEVILGRDGVVREAYGQQAYGERVLQPFASALYQVAGNTTNTNSSSLPILINHYGPEFTFLYLSYYDVLQGTIPDDFFRNRFVLIGVKALGIGDSHITPFSQYSPTPGVEIQASILNNLIDGNSLTRFHDLSWLFIGFICLFALFVWPNTGLRWNILLISSFSVSLLICSFMLFKFFLFFSPVPALLYLGISFGLYLFMERFLTAREIFNEIQRLDQHLETKLERLYTNVPAQFFNPHPTPGTNSSLKKHLAHLQAGVKVLSLQHHFIENVLREELLPLILWDKQKGIVIIANNTFSSFWSTHFPGHTALPNLSCFFTMLADNSESSRYDVTAINAVLNENKKIPAIDIGLTEHGLKKYYRFNIQAFDVADIAFGGVLGILTDVTEIKEMERLKDKIVSIVSHELKLPLTVIRGYGEMLSDTLKNTEKQYIDEICSQTERLNKLIETFLDVARIEEKQQDINMLPLNFLELVKEAKMAVLPIAEKKSIEILARLPFRTSPLLGDPPLLLQAVINLLDNAIKFSPECTQITMELTEENDTLSLCIADQGPGIPAASQKAIFEKFNRGQHPETTKGFGLGLSFVQQAIQAHGGKLWLQSETGKGACFCFSLNKNTE